MPGQYEIFTAYLNQFRPTITGWNRIEGRPRSEDLERALSCEICDAVWMLAQQLRFRELRGEDVASPVCAKIKVSTSPIDRVRLGAGAFEPYDGALPLEVRAEREHPPLNLRFALEAGRLWNKYLAKGVADGMLGRDYADDLRAAFPIAVPAPVAANVDSHAYQPVHELYAAAAGRAIDGAALYAAARAKLANAGPDPLDKLAPPPTGTDRAALEELLENWFAAMRARYALDEQSDGGAWRPEALGYALSCSAPGFDGEGRIVLSADDYGRGRLDWHSFDLGDAADDAAVPVPEGGRGPESRVERFLPARAGFPGMPAARLWEFENRKTSFGRITAHTTDLARLIFIEFGLAFGNDWFLLPLETEVGRLLRVDGLVVTDTFGERTWIPAFGQGDGTAWERWAAYVNTTARTGLPDSRFLLMADVVETVLESEPQENVCLARDEVANMVFAVEKRITLDDGRCVDGFEAFQARRRFLEPMLDGAGATLEPLQGAQIAYRLMVDNIPENWIPFVPVRMPDDDNREIQLQRAALLRDLGGDGPEVAPPRTQILRPAWPAPYFVHEEQVPRSGVEIVLTYQRTRHATGRPIVWCGRARRSGRGQGSSGLAFDRIRPR